MLKESSTSRTLGRNTSRNPQFEANENEFEVSQNLNSYPPPRTPLNSIPDPSQCQKESQESEVNSHYKLEAIRPGRSSDKRFEASSDRLGNLGFNYGTPRVLGRNGKAQSEPNSAQSTPARNASRVSLGGAVGFCAGSRVPYSGGGKAGSSGTFLKGISVANSELCKEVQHFELKEDPSFWMDHNVQVLIRIRPLNNIEKLSEGYDRCLRQESAQTLVWVGHPETRFTFDHIACETLSQENLFRVAGVPMVENCLSGYNSCMFAYGQTGSGKTYTMMGEIKETEGHLTEDSGITPRVFDYLFTRIKAEEESRRDDKLCYSCKCSFLEIYNEQIADLLEPSSTNLQLREDMKKGVYVENLTERSVGTVNDVLKLLLQGTANRKVAATHMNCKSSRSHSVFTCTIESRWEKDSMTHFRFARLNLVDLAGSERQKSSGADSERLKEAANINKSLSTLGLVIMTLVDLTHGKPRHVPYRDSRLTFLLQDSLGGNSKTMIIANVSPSICSANETLSTLKFAQRAKLIQNNAKVNEDASGDVNALQWQIQQLKGQLSFLIKHNNFPSLVSNLESNSEIRRLSESSEGYGSFIEKATAGHKLCIQNKEIKCMKAALLGALRREKMAETTIKNLQAEIERMNCLALQKEEDTQHTAFKLRLCKEKIKQLELLVDGALSAEKYLLEENRTLQEQVEELQARIDSNPESTRLALENDRILHHLQQFQNFYEHGERERLLTELSELRDQLVVNLQEKITFSMQNENQDNDTKQELEDCQIMNSNLLRDVDRLQTQLGKYVNSDRVKSDSVLHYSFELPDELQKTDKCSLVDAISLKSDFGDDMSSYTWETDGVLASKIEGQEVLEAKLEKMNKDLEEVKLLNDQYQEKWALQLSQKHQIESVCEEVEMETTRTILHLQEEIAGLQSDLEGRLSSIAQENTELRNMVATKEEDIRTLCSEWERAILELTTFLLDGSRSLKDACGQAESITCSFPEVNARISEHIGMAVRSYIEKEETIQQLQSSLEEAQKMLLDMELKISSLKDATVALSAFQQLQNNQGNEDNGDSIQLRMLLNEKTNMVRMLENEVKYKNDQLSKAEKQAEAAILLVKWLCDSQNVVHTNNDERDISIPKQDVHSKPGGQTTSENEGDRNHLILDDLIPQVELTKLEVSQMENASDAFHADRDMHRPNVQTSAFSLSPAHRDLVLDSVKQIQDFRIEVTDSKTHSKISECCAADSLTTNTYKCLQFEDWHHVLYQIQQELVNMNIRLNIVENCISSKIYLSNCSLMDEDLVDSDDLSADSSSISDFSTEAESIASGSILHGSTNTRRFKSAGKITEHMVNLKSERGFATQADNQESKNIGHHMKSSIQSEAAASYLRNELYAIYEAFNKLHVNFSELLKELDVGICSYPKEERKEAPFELMTLRDEAGWQNNTEVFGDKKIKLADGFLTKFEEAHATVKEADIMLHALTEAYEDAKQMTVTWKQVGENLMMERESLAEENQQLKSLICHKEEENQLLKDQIHSSLIEMTNSVPMLQECFLQVQTDVEKKLTAMYSDVLLIQQDIIYIIKSLRTSVEDICSQTMEERFVSFVLSNCHVTELVNKFPFFSVNHNFQSRQGELGHSLKNCSSVESVMVTGNEELGKKGQHAVVQNLQEEQDPPHSRLMYENMALRKDLDRKEELLEGLLFDFRLLQELASNGKDIKEETEKLIVSLSQVRYELENKTSQLEDTLIQNRKLEGSLADIEKALSTSNYELRIAQDSIGKLSDENAELREHLKELYAKKSEAEEELDELKDVIKGLEKEIVNLTSSLENRSLSLLEGVEDELRKVIIERDQLHEETCILNDKLEVAYSLADEKDAIAMEARQESEASKLYAEQKEEEVKILEHSVEELECTINVLEKKVHEMEEEVGRHHLIRDSLEMKLQALKERLQAVDNLSQYADSDSTSVQQTNEPTSRQPARKITELREALNRIKLLEEEKAEQDKQIKQCKEYISEVVLHAEAQTLQYQQKYKSLESMFREVKKEISNSTSTSTALTSERTEKSSIRARGSSSPFRCISNLVQQMNQEKDQELSMARLRVEELEALAASRQKEVCMLQTRLAAAESMTHDVIRDLLGVKMDITNYASMIDQNQILKLVEDAHHLREEFLAKEKEVLNQRLLINELLEERESCKLELKTRDADILATQIGAQKLQERDQLLSAQNEMLKMDKTNLMRKVAELDDMVKTLFAARDNQQSTKIKDRGSLKLSNVEMARPRRLSQSERLLSRENNKLA